MFESAMISCELSSDELTSLGMGLAQAFEEEAAMEWTGKGKTEGEASHRRIPQPIQIAVLIQKDKNRDDIEIFESTIASHDQPVLESNGSESMKRTLKENQ